MDDEQATAALLAYPSVLAKARQGAFELALGLAAPQWPQADKERLAKCYATRVVALATLCQIHDYMKTYDCQAAAEAVMAICRFFERTDDNIERGIASTLTPEHRRAWDSNRVMDHVTGHRDDAIRVMEKHQLARQVAQG